MPQLGIIEETDAGMKETEKKTDLESITETAEAEEKNTPSTSSAIESKTNKKSIEENKIDKFNLSAVVKIEKTKTITSLTSNSEEVEDSTVQIEDKTKNNENTSSEVNTNEATNCESPTKVDAAEVTIEKNLEMDSKTTEQTSIDKIEEELEILLNKNENQDSSTSEQLNKTFERKDENKVETSSSTTLIDKQTIDSKECGNETTLNILLDEKSLNTETSKAATVVQSTDVHLNDTPPILSSENESLNNKADLVAQVNISKLNETKIVNNEDVNTVKPNAEEPKETSNDITSKSQLKPSEELPKDNVLSQQSNKDTIIKESLIEQSGSTEIPTQDEKLEGVIPSIDNKDSSQTKEYHNKSLGNLLPEQLDITAGSDGSFHINLSIPNICSSKEDLAESPKKEAPNSESDVLNKSDSSDKENTSMLNQITEDVTNTKSPLIERKTPLTDKSFNENNQSRKSLDDSCEPMDVDDPPLSYIDITEKTDSVHAKERSSTPNKKNQNSVEFSDAFANESLNTIDDSKIEESQKNRETSNDAASEPKVDADVTEIDNNFENANIQNLTEKDVNTVTGTTDNENLEDKIVDKQTKEKDNIASKDVEGVKWKEDGYSSPVFSIDSSDISDEENVSVSKESKRKSQHGKIQGSTSTTEIKQPILEADSTVEISKLDVTDNTCKKSIEDTIVDKASADDSIVVIHEISKENVTELISTPSKNLTPCKDLKMRNVSPKSSSTPSKDKEDIVNEIKPDEKGSSKSAEKEQTSIKKVEVQSGTKSKSPSKKLNIKEFAVNRENDECAKKTKSTPTKKNSPKRSNNKSPKEQNTTASDEDADLDSSRGIETPQSKKKLSGVQSNIEEKHEVGRGKSSEIGTTKEKSPKKKSKIVSVEHEEIRNEISKIIKDTVDELISSSDAENQEDNGEVNEFFDDMAEEGEEDTPSEDSNDIIYEGESINSSDTYTDDDDDESYENDSFIDDEHDKHDLLSGEEDFLQDEPIEKKSPKKSKPAASAKVGKKHKRILAPSSSESEEDNQQSEKNILNEANDEVQDSKQSEKENQEKSCNSDNTEAKKVPEEVEKLTTKTSNADGVSDVNTSENLMPSTNDVIDIESNSDSESVSSVKEESKAGEEVNTSLSEKKSKRTSSITIQENIKLEDIQDGELSSRISKVVDWFYSGIKGSGDAGNISLNVSLDYADQPNEEKVDEEEAKPATDATKSGKRKSQELKKNTSSERIALEEYEDEVFVENIEEPQERDELRTIPKKSKRKSVQKQVEKESADDEKVKTSPKRLSDENIQHISPKKNKYDFDFVVEEVITIDDKKMIKKKKKNKKSINKGDDGTLRAGKKQQPSEDKDTVPKKRKRLYLETTNIPEFLNSDDEKPNDTKIKKKKRVPLSDENNLDNIEYVEKIDKFGRLKKKKSHLNEFNVEFDESKKSKKLIYTTEKTDHVPCSSGILKKCISADTHVSKHEVIEAKQTAKKPKRKIPRKLLPTKSTDLNDSWDSEIFDRIVRPSKSNKKMVDMKMASRKTKTEIDSFNSKDFKNKMLYDSNRIKRMDTKALLRQRKKI